MVNIKLTEKYRPFSCEAGTSVLLPRSAWRMTVYPAKLILESLLAAQLREKVVIFPQIEGPITSFTIMQDLERGWVRIFGEGKKGYFSYRLLASSDGITLFVERSPTQGIPFDWNGEVKQMKQKEAFIIPVVISSFPLASDGKMHFGCCKKQDWSLVKRRLSLEEILPIWFEIGKDILEQPSLNVGTAGYLQICADQLAEKNRNQIGSSFLELFKVGFEGIFSPRLIDTDYQGYVTPEKIPKEASPLLLLQEGARLIRRLFIEKSGDTIAILPCLPKELHAGRFIGIDCDNRLKIDLEWSKKLVRRLVLRPKKAQTLTLSFQKGIASFRLRNGWRGRGKSISVGTPLALEKDRLYVLDRFQK